MLLVATAENCVSAAGLCVNNHVPHAAESFRIARSWDKLHRERAELRAMRRVWWNGGRCLCCESQRSRLALWYKILEAAMLLCSHRETHGQGLGLQIYWRRDDMELWMAALPNRCDEAVIISLELGRIGLRSWATSKGHRSRRCRDQTIKCLFH